MNNIERIASEIDTLRVPAFDYSAIRARTNARQQKPGRGLIAASVLAVLAPVAAFAAVHYWPVRVIETPARRTEIYSRAKDVRFARPFTPAWQQRIGAAAPYRVVWPSALPASVQPANGISFGYSAMFLSYRCSQPHGFLQFIITPKAAANHTTSAAKLPMQMMLTRTNEVYDWTAGAERVRLETNCLTAGEIAAVRSSMIAAGAAQR